MSEPPAGTNVVPAHHHDYLLDVPAYGYRLTCGHTVHYHTPVEPWSYGYCRSCKRYWRRTGDVEELPPRANRALSDDELTERLDEAIIRNRIADILVWRDGYDSSADVVAKMVGCSTKTVYRVQKELGLDAA